jgi:hypothetical protein
MTRENSSSKARRILVEGRLHLVRLDHAGLLALVRDGVRETIAYDARTGRWSCTCERQMTRCAHVKAVQLVAVVEDKPSLFSVGGVPGGCPIMLTLPRRLVRTDASMQGGAR